MKNAVTTIVKLLFVACLVYWLVGSGKLEFSHLRIYIDRPEVALMNASLWIFGYLMLGALRWWILLRGLDLEVSYFKAVRLQMIGFFFNTAIPGAVGGDIVKAVYVIREQRASRKTPALLTVLLDRVVGLVGLFLIAGVAMAFNWQFVSHDHALRTLSLVSLAVFSTIILGFVIAFYPFKPGRDPIERLLTKSWPGFSVLRSIYEALRTYRSKPLLLLAVVSIACLLQTAGMAYAIYITTIVAGFSPDIPTFATIYPLALMTTAVPLAPGGLGVGHVAFDSMFALVGWKDGANVFNVVILGQLAMNLLGFVPYLMYRSKLPDTEELTMSTLSTP